MADDTHTSAEDEDEDEDEPQWVWEEQDHPDPAVTLTVGRAMFLSALDPMMFTRPRDGAILDANPAARRTLGYRLREIRSVDRDRLLDPRENRTDDAVLIRALTGGYVGELSLRRADGTCFPAEVSSSMFEVAGEDYAVLIFRDVSEQRALERHLREALAEMGRLATIDELTGLLNRRGFLTVGQELVEQARRDNSPLFLLAADVDGLKKVNDEHGHAVGDQMLRDVAVTLQETLRGVDVVGRMGGDEFAVILAGARSADESEAAIVRIGQGLAQRCREAERPYALTISFGFASSNDDIDLEALLHSADLSLYQAKRHRPEPGQY